MFNKHPKSIETNPAANTRSNCTNHIFIYIARCVDGLCQTEAVLAIGIIGDLCIAQHLIGNELSNDSVSGENEDTEFER